MATGTVMPSPVFTGFDSNGDPVSGGLLYVYDAGTSTPATTYSDVNLTIANANPVVLNSAGRAVVYLAGASYKFVLKTAAGATVWSQDNVSSVLIANLFLQPLVLLAFDLQTGGAIEDRHQARRVEIGLFEKVERAGLTRLERARDGAHAADHDHFRRRIDRLELPQQRNAVDVGQHQIQQHDVRLPCAEDLRGARANGRSADLVTRAIGRLLDDHLQPVGHRRLVVYDQHAAPQCRLH